MPGRFPRALLLFGLAVFVFAVGSEPAFAQWRAGAARVKITPERPTWMSGYASRTRPADGTLIDLWAKALVLEDGQNERLCLVTLDLVGIDRGFAQRVCEELLAKHGLERRQVVLLSSHTHSGPVIRSNLRSMYFLDEAQWERIADYSVDLQQKLLALVGEALKDVQPARIAWGTGHSSIAVNRRENREADVPQLREQGLLKGPVDHDVPVLTVRTPEGKLRAILFGYACHATVLDSYQWCGDYPGYAQLELEKAHPEAVALFFAGCGADQNPLPRRKVELAEEYGQSLARSVEAVVQGPLTAIEGRLSSTYREIPLPLATLPTRDELEQQAASDKPADKYSASRAKLLLTQLDAGMPLSPTYPYPVQTMRLGTGLHWVALGGEVTVDYSLRLKRELGRDRTWVAGYANDVMAYIPSVRVLKEGGYEGGGAMVYYGLPTVWAPDVEEMIVRTVHALAGTDKEGR